MISEDRFSYQTLLTNILEYSVDGMVVTDETGTVMLWNEAQEKIVNIAVQDAVGKKLWDVQFSAAPPEYQTEEVYQNLKSSLRNFFETGKAPWSERIMEQAFFADGRKIVIQSIHFPMKTEKGFMLAGIIRDITGLKELEKASLQKEVEKIRADQLQHEIDVRNREISAMTLHCSSKNILLIQTRDSIKNMLANNEIYPEKLLDLMANIESNISMEKDWETFKIHFEQVHPLFFKKLSESFPELTMTDLKLCAYLKIGFSHKEILRISNLSYDGIKSAKFRLKKKLKLDKNQSLSSHLRNL
ncbi:MAG: PAS domain S-box protein [Bacteroidales bacterium]|nr:PAS domain S-box protein [Bacteroidales bacterium]